MAATNLELDWVDTEIDIDPEHSVNQLSGKFRTVKDGLPELIKNSKDAYFLKGVAEPLLRQILVAYSSESSSLVVLDFCGATRTDLQRWKKWSNREGSQRESSREIEGGHGNGGKGFMVRGSAVSYIESCFDGKRTKFVFDNSVPGKMYISAFAREKAERIDDVLENRPHLTLERVLKDVHASISDLPAECLHAFEERGSYTAVVLKGLTDCKRKNSRGRVSLGKNIAEQLQKHPQASNTLKSCRVWVLADGELRAEPLSVELPPPMLGFENLPLIELPAELRNPETGEVVQTGVIPGRGEGLQLCVTERQLRMTDDWRGFNVIRARNERNIVSTWETAVFARGADSAYIYGELTLYALHEDEHSSGSERTSLADTDFVRAVKIWIAGHVKELAARIHRSKAQSINPEEVRKAGKTLDEFRGLMRDFLGDAFEGLEPDDQNSGDQLGNGSGKRKRVVRKGGIAAGTRVDKVVLEDSSPDIAIALGSRIELAMTAYEVRDNKDFGVRDANLALEVEDSSIARAEGRILISISQGDTRVRAISGNGVSSRWLPISVVSCKGVRIEGLDRGLKRRERKQLRIVFNTDCGERTDLFVEASVIEENCASIRRTGMLTAKDAPGEFTLLIVLGPNASDVESFNGVVLEEWASGDSGGAPVPDLPQILMCQDIAPGHSHLPAEQQTVAGGTELPTIWETPEFRNIVWINQFSKESCQIRKRGSSGISGIATRTYYSFLALKCFEVLKRLWVRKEIGERQVTEVEFSNLYAEAEITCAGFIDTAFLIAERVAQNSQEHSDE